MSRIVRSGVASAAFLLACGLIGTGSPAFAAGKGHAAPVTHGHAAPSAHGHSTAHSHPAPHKPVDKLAGVRRGATNALAASTARVKRIAAAEGASSALSTDDQAALASATTADLAALTADGQAVATATSTKAILAASQSGLATALGADLQYRVVLAAANAQAKADSLTADAAPVSEQASTLAADGTDVSTVTDPLDDLASQVDQAQASAATARTAGLALPVTPSATQLRSTGAVAHQALDTVASALTAGEADLTAATTALAALQAPTA